MTKDMVLWLEDVAASVKEQINYCKKKGLKVLIVQTDHRFHDVLKANYNRVCLIIVDVMLRGVQNLEAIDIPSVETGHGHRAGWMIVREYLRADSQQAEYTSIPVLMLSTRPFEPEEMNYLEQLKTLGEIKNHAWIRYLEKSSAEMGWKKVFRQIIDEIVLGDSNEG